MDLPTAELITQDGKQPRVTEGADGQLTATRWYRVNTAAEGKALLALGLPKRFDPYPHGELTYAGNLVCTVREAQYSHGTDDPSTGLDGWSEVRCDYSNPISGRIVPQVGLKYTEVGSTTGSATIIYGIDADGTGVGVKNEPIQNGQGAQKETGGVELNVVTFLKPADFTTLLGRLVDLQTAKAFNTAGFTVPPVRPAVAGVGGFAVPAESAQYIAFAHEPAGDNLIKLTQTIRISPGGRFEAWRKENELGLAVGPIILTPKYALDSFDGLWG